MKEPEFDTRYFQNYPLPFYSPTVSVGKPAIWSICWFYIDKRSGELVPSNGCTQGLYMMLIKKACPWLQALRHLVFSTRVWKWEKTSLGMAPPCPPHSLQMLWNTITTTKTCGNMHAPSCSHNPNHSWKTVANQSSSTQHPPWRKPTTFKDFSAVVSCVKELTLAVFWKDKQLLFSWKQPKLLETWS